MAIVYLNGDYMPASEAKISPMDRGFLFGDGIYEVVPSYNGRFVGLAPHIERLFNGLTAIGITPNFEPRSIREVAQRLMLENNPDGMTDLAVYIHVSRGADIKRDHAFPTGLTPTLFAYTFEIPPFDSGQDKIKTYRVNTQMDLRWHRCNIKSTALLGNVLHFQKGKAAGFDETLLFNQQDELTEAAACNVFIVKNGRISTPSLDSQKLPGITRLLLIRILKDYGKIVIEEGVITRQQVMAADEVWLTSSTKGVAPVVIIDAHQVGNGQPGPFCIKARALFDQHKFEYNNG